MAKRDSYYFSFWTERFLGLAERCDTFLRLLEGLDGGRWIPDRWGHYEPIRHRYAADSQAAITKAWTEERPQGSGRVRNLILFRKLKPRATLEVSVTRSVAPLLNNIDLEVERAPFSDERRPERLVQMAVSLIEWSGAVYATAFSSKQKHRRRAVGTPLERLERLDWLTFFGAPYLEMFGRQRVMAAPFHEVRELNGGVLELATESPESPELVESDRLLMSLETELGEDAFASSTLAAARRVPRFDLRDTTLGSALGATSSRL